MRIVVKKCEACGANYNYKVSGGGSPRDWNKKRGVTGKHCKECAPKHYVPPKPRDWEWVPATDVTPEQMFEWDEENTRQQAERYEAAKEKYARTKNLKDFIFFPHMKRVYVGYIKADGSDAEEAIWSHGYRMVYWCNSREVVSLCKQVKKAC